MLRPPTLSSHPEWLETDGLGGFSLGSTDLLPRRRYHSLLTVALNPPTHRVVLLNALELSVRSESNDWIPLTQFLYYPNNLAPQEAARSTFSQNPFPTWTFTLPNNQDVQIDCFRVRGTPTLVMTARLLTNSSEPLALFVRPLLSGRSIHDLHKENPLCNLSSRRWDSVVQWQLYPETPPLYALATGDYFEHPEWYRNFRYEEDELRGYSGGEDLASPGYFVIPLTTSRAVMQVSTDPPSCSRQLLVGTEQQYRSRELERRGRFPDRLEQLVEHFIVSRGTGTSIIAGYPWFTDWGRDTFIAFRGLLLTTGRQAEAKAVLLTWAKTISAGMLPNMFPDVESPPLFNSVDASLWFIVACSEYWGTYNIQQQTTDEDKLLVHTILAIIAGYEEGTRFRIRCQSDGLLACGLRGIQLTWMDAKVGDTVFTPRVGKPVEIQALWINSLRIGARFASSLSTLADQAEASFEHQFWNPARDMLYDVVDENHISGAHDATFRPNQIFAIGGLPHQLLFGEKARSVVSAAERELFTPGGIRSLTPSDPSYHGKYSGSPWERDAAYHQGTCWPWLLGPFIEAWVRVHGSTNQAKQTAYEKFFEPFLQRCLNNSFPQCPELSDGDAPFDPKGAPFQAWTLGETLRIRQLLTNRSTN
jgi:predicted glycogen debranching enzyme